MRPFPRTIRDHRTSPAAALLRNRGRHGGTYQPAREALSREVTARGQRRTRRLVAQLTALLLTTLAVVVAPRAFAPAGWSLIAAIAAAFVGQLVLALRAGTPGEWDRTARRLSRRWRRLPAAFLTCAEFADTGLPRQAAAALGGAEQAELAVRLVDGGFAGTVGELIAATRGVLRPAAPAGAR